MSKPNSRYGFSKVGIKSAILIILIKQQFKCSLLHGNGTNIEMLFSWTFIDLICQFLDQYSNYSEFPK